MPVARTASVTCSVLAVAALVACGSAEPEPIAVTTTPSTTTVESVPPDPAFEAADPCDLITSNDVEGATGVEGLSGEWLPNEDATIIGCTWGTGPGSVNNVLTVGLDTRFLTIGRTLDTVNGLKIKVAHADKDACTLNVELSGDRRLGVEFLPSTQQKKAEKNPSDEMWCGRTLDLVKAALPRLNWT
ncbi:DUF3558 family protein [Rhodococcus oryzae]|uniref:DUF3558 family protein n=1 Tax=Rhodococcus oryzae TaxID=2571143 RepID=UPI00378D96B7